MGLFDMFGKSFGDQVNNAMNDIGEETHSLCSFRRRKL